MRKQIWESLNCKQKKWHNIIWLGYCDSNTGMSESESDALPLGDTPKFKYLFIITQKE